MPRVPDPLKSGFLTQDGMIKIVRWAQRVKHAPNTLGTLSVDTRARPSIMHASVATGEGLVSNGYLGADLIRVPRGGGFEPHTHPGDHLLICVAGEGTITYDGKVYPTEAGQIYMIEGAVPHAVGAITDHCILAVGAPHKPVDAVDRMTPTEYQAVAADLGTLECLICKKTAYYPQMLHDEDCPHCPCRICVNTLPEDR